MGQNSIENTSENDQIYPVSQEETPATEPPWLTIDTVGRYAHGDIIPVHGLTNIVTGNIFEVMVYPVSTDEQNPQEFMSRYSSMTAIPVVFNRSVPYPWSMELDTATLVPGEYIVSIEGLGVVDGVVHLVTTKERFRIYDDAMNMNAGQNVVSREGGGWTNGQWSLVFPEIEGQISQPKAKMWVAFNGSRLGGMYVNPGYSSLWHPVTPYDRNTPRLGIIVSGIGNDTFGEYVSYAVSWNTQLNQIAE